ncbi:MAG TPA: hypothetical protein ENH29_09910 [Bacteroidetes bacterium]|nr:hypothetical protein [Bacteroidota bacterium]
MSKKIWLVSLVLTVWVSFSFAQERSSLFGKWELIPDKSSEISLYRTLSVDLQKVGQKLTLIEKWGSKRSFSDTLHFKTDGKVYQNSIKNRVWPTNVFMGISQAVGEKRKVTANWMKNGEVLTIHIAYPVLASQGKVNLTEKHIFQWNKTDDLLTCSIERSTRKSGSDFKYVLKRAGTNDAYFMRLQDNWQIDELLPVQAFLISLQGVVNADAPRLYFIYPKSWAFNYTPAVFDFYKDKKNFTFTELRNHEIALQRLKQYVKGYVVWDKSVRTSLIVAFTVAGLEKAVVVSEDMLPLVEKAGLKMVEDFRWKFAGKSDAEIYRWAYEHYWDRCNKDFIVWLGGDYGKIMKPGVADWGIYKHVFFNDLSTRVTDTEEYALANKLLSEMNPMAMVMGWHSYGKDLEREHVSLCSHYGHRVEGLNTLPNLSFSSQVHPAPGFKFKNHHNVVPGKKYVPEKKVYITCIQTDGLGIGAWLKPGRGEIPYAWETIINYSWLAPAMMEFFYSTATANDYFIGALSGPGYLYPKAVPPKLLPNLIKEAKRMMDLLDLQVFELMDYSEGATVEGNTELTKQVVDAYYKGMPDVIGFVNGYAPAFTFTVRNGKPLISYDYYLSPTRKKAAAVADLHELAEINKRRPYFLLMHVRENSDIKRVKGILDGLGSKFEVVPLDIFLKMAGRQPTFKERFLQK